MLGIISFSKKIYKKYWRNNHVGRIELYVIQLSYLFCQSARDVDIFRLHVIDTAKNNWHLEDYNLF